MGAACLCRTREDKLIKAETEVDVLGNTTIRHPNGKPIMMMTAENGVYFRLPNGKPIAADVFSEKTKKGNVIHRLECPISTLNHPAVILKDGTFYIVDS